MNLSVEQLIKTDYLQEGQKFPLVIQPNSAEVDLISWAENNRELSGNRIISNMEQFYLEVLM